MLYVQALSELDVPLTDEETAGRRLLVSLAFGLVQGALSPKDVGDGLSMTVAARTEEETQFLSVAAEYSEWIGPDYLPEWERELLAAAQLLVTSTGLGPGICEPASRHD
ncbi:hypothetical protein ACFT0G_04915 [Streptomyces sp. NPDC057020]|uniref:hypothetical protein n=1 Tax=unclassified Streptomyces TaxID=2593676 RepID=UPI003628FC03